MNRCPITYQSCGAADYSEEGIRLLSGKAAQLNAFPYAQSQQLELALEYSDKLSIQGVQPKLSVRFNGESATFEPVQKNGLFILKLQHRNYSEVPQNEDLTMRLAKLVGIDIPFHGMIYAIDRTLLYFIERFDRQSPARPLAAFAKKKKKQGALPKTSVEDFAQLASLSRETKYAFSMEKLAPIIDQYCSFPMAEKKKLFRLAMFSFLIGNEDLHLKNFSLIRHSELTELSPAYDLVNSSIVIKPKEELALSLKGKRSNFTREDLVEYYGSERLRLPPSVIGEVLDQIRAQISAWKELIGMSFLSEEKKQAYLQLLGERLRRIFK